ncbi:MAG TPA: NTP transferase domain-containing protein [Chthoniobacterales bacterium]|nr:NTP transferase domain-containing protein [Chthoniobacterales bacterium]
MTSISEAVVLMAGTGSRLSSVTTGGLKPLTRVVERPLIRYIFDALNVVGIRTIHAVVGYQSETLISQVSSIVPAGLDVRFVENPNWEKQNGLSVLAAEGRVNSPFVLTMSDHLFDPELLDILLQRAQPDVLSLAIDRKIESIVDIDDAMKVQVERDRVIAIGKDLPKYDAIDTGFFVANVELFTYLRRAMRGGDCSLADGVRLMAAAGKVQAIDIGAAWWQDVDTPQTLIAAENHLRTKIASIF